MVGLVGYRDRKAGSENGQLSNRPAVRGRVRGSPEVVPSVAAQVTSFFKDVPQRRGPLIVRPGALIGPAAVQLESGSRLEVSGVLPADVPFGYHRLVDDSGDRVLIVTPGRCHLPVGWRA